MQGKGSKRLPLDKMRNSALLDSVERTLYEDLREVIATGRRFNQREISIIKSSEEYDDCSFTEKAFIDVLLTTSNGLPAHMIPDAQRAPASTPTQAKDN